MKKLPIGIQSFSKLREYDCVYIDKTSFVAQLVEHPGAFFLSRPRRFGKSLLVDTIQCLFEGQREWFRGLFIEQRWDWSVTHPVIKLDFAEGILHSREALEQRIVDMLRQNLERLGLEDQPERDLAGRFSYLIRAAAQTTGQKTVVLIDEYDKPILDNIDGPEMAAEMREVLKNLYSVLKAQDAHLRFVFMTGVSQFSKVSLFSGINQIRDISLSRQYATLCGYTQPDLETHFADHLAGVDWQRLKAWYNGYNFLGEPVYNPYDILLFISEGYDYRNYWFETGSPSFLIKLFQQNNYFLPDLEQLEVSEELLGAFEIEQIHPVTLLFQSGYLTIERAFAEFGGQAFYRLKIPNQEVRQALMHQLFAGYTQQTEVQPPLLRKVYHALQNADLSGLQAHLKSLFAGIPWRYFTHTRLADSEGYYASVLYAFLSSLNATLIPEDISNKGQADLTVMVGDCIYVLEIKRDTQADYQPQTPNPTLQQIQQRGYADKYRNSGKRVFSVGMIFNTYQRNLVQMDWQALLAGE
ncbi:MAG: ATP-binding protein [Methylomicrobium sp.]